MEVIHKTEQLLSKFLVWRIRHVSERNFVLILAGVIGAFSGLFAVGLKILVHRIDTLLTGDLGSQNDQYYFFVFPLIGLTITFFLAKFLFRDSLGHGVTTVIYAIAKGSSLLKRRLSISRAITAAITVGFGGSVGLEAPIVVTGSSIGSNIARIMHMGYRNRTLLIGCGAAASISGIFNSPIAGVIFTIEVLLSDVSIKKFIPLLIASVTGSLVSLLLLGKDILFFVKSTDPFFASDVPFYIGLGIFSGLVAVYFTRTHYFLEKKMQSITKPLPRILIGGILLGLIVFLFPPIYGEGYRTIKLLLSEGGQSILNHSLFMDQVEDPWFIVSFVIGLVLIKAMASALTVGSGGSGGIFAPSLFIGGLSGFFFARVMALTGLGEVSTRNFTLVGMCGVMSGVLHAPLTGIFLIAEITGGYTLFVPLMLTSAISFITISYFEPHSIYTKKLIEDGDLITNSRDKQVLSLLDMKKLIEKDFKTIHPEASLGELIQVVKVSKRNIFPVVNSELRLVGIVKLDDVRRIMFDTEKYDKVVVKTIMNVPKAVIKANDDMNTVMGKFESSGSWNLPIIQDDIYIGFYSKSKIFNAYRSRLIKQEGS